MTRREQLLAAWQRGRLEYKLRLHQRVLYAFLSALFTNWVLGQDRESIVRVLNCARRFGKTFTVCLLITELCLRIPGFIVRYAAPTEKQLRKIIRPVMREILKDCPKDLRPEWNNADSAYYFKNGSEWHLAGTDKENAEKLRGTGCDLGVLDEAGSMPDMEYVANDILLPQTLDRNGCLLIISTPPKTPGHPFVKACFEAMKTGDYLVQTVHDNTYLSEKQKEKICRASGGESSTTWRREYLCEFVVDLALAVVPEFTEAAMKRDVLEWKRPTHFLPFVSMDVGYFDSTFVLFGYYDFLAASLIVEDELVIERARTDQIATGVQAKEAGLYPGKEIYLRKTDIDHRLIADMAAEHKLYFSPTAKDDLEAQVNKVREWVKQGRIKINPRCVQLIAQLRAAIWNKSRNEFEHVRGFGHFDGVAALIYMVRNAPVHVNPFPAFPPGIHPITHFIPPGFGERRDTNADALEQAFGPRLFN